MGVPAIRLKSLDARIWQLPLQGSNRARFLVYLVLFGCLLTILRGSQSEHTHVYIRTRPFYYDPEDSNTLTYSYLAAVPGCEPASNNYRPRSRW